MNPFTRLRRSLCRKPPNPMMYTNCRKRLRSRKSSNLCVICLIALIPHTDGCSQVISINAHEEVCTITENAETCTYNEATVITLQPLQQETCLAIKDRSNKLVAVVSLKVDNIQFRCQKNAEFFTRDHKLVSESIHRCYLAGSCVENACENTSPSDQLKEFSHTANNSPGYTFCSQSCGCITCEGCFFCQPSCLFYRIYALPTSHTIYTIFNCPSWETIVTAEVTIRQEDSAITNTLQLYPGQTTTWNNLRFSLIGTIVPQLPISSSTFMETDMGISIIKPAHKGQLATHSAGQLQCSTKQHAEQFKCIFASKACTCTHGLREASCLCSPGDMEELMKASPLPLVSKSFIILSREAPAPRYHSTVEAVKDRQSQI
ncbi:hypothetical protein ANCCEY_14692 [Ancylostoma ceylanicum]|nr:hypothetical protein ANCCEY_14692 [Ancylostoma ceylanicum]